MRNRFEGFYRGLLGLLAAGLFWSVWSGAQAAPGAGAVLVAAGASPAVSTNGVAGGTNGPAGGGGEHSLGLNLLPTIDRQYLTFGLDQVPVLRDVHLAGIALWQYIASFLFIFLAFYVAKFLDFLARVWLRRWVERTSTKADDMLLELANGPVKIIAFVFLLHLGLSVFEWPTVAERWLSNGLKIVVAVSLTYALLRLVDVFVGVWRERSAGGEADRSFDQQLAPILRKALKAVVVVVASLVTLDNVGVNITGLVASLSIGGLALGLAAQDTVANLFGAVSVLIDKPFQVGDRIQFDNVDGVVESIGLRSTRLRSLDGFVVTVPNKTMGNATVTNVALRPTIRTQMTVGLTYDTPAERVKAASEMLEQIFRAHPGTHDVLVGFNRFGDFSLNISVTHWWKNGDHKAYLAGIQEIHLEIKRRFDAEGIQFAFPTQTVILQREPATQG